MRGSNSFTPSAWLRKLLVALLVLVVLGALVYRSRGAITLVDFSWERLGQALREARISLLLLSMFTIYACYAIRALRWVRFSQYLGRPTFVNVFTSTLVGFSTLFLLGRAGEPIRPLLIARKDRLPVSGTFGIYVLERVFDVGSTVLIVLVSVLAFPATLATGSVSAAWLARVRSTGLALLVGLLAALLFLVYFRLHGAEALERRLAGWHTRKGWRLRLAGLTRGFSEGLHAIRTASDLFAAVAYSLVHWALVAMVYLWVAHSFGGRLAEIDFPRAMLVLTFSMVGSALQLPAIGGGSQAATFLAFTVIFGVEKESAAVAAIALWLVTFAAVILVGAPLLIREGWSVGELRRLARAEAEAEAAGTHAVAPDVPVKPGDFLG
ncbi:MAG TPA: lysylphosphatidylglycerol synthase transmembrane domain-containing protein [Candidatus Acidoferrales bacterium]|nr:lysylphosphatidylglycerol synthase transmembrane domain-containing protein [Candidatus Acidoferrales bacterium]